MPSAIRFVFALRPLLPDHPENFRRLVMVMMVMMTVIVVMMVVSVVIVVVIAIDDDIELHRADVGTHHT
jgi:uncharacterized membrane protein YqjE